MVTLNEITQKYPEARVIEMGKMKPLQIGRIVEDEIYEGIVVMRTASSISFEVINLSQLGENECWTNENCPLKVQLFHNPVQVKFTVHNKL